MDKMDERISQALTEADRRFLAEMEEKSFFSQLFGLFRGRNAWVVVAMTVAQTGLFLAAVYCGWQFFLAQEVLAALRWGLPAVTLAVLATQIKMAVMAQLQADRVIAALRATELRLAH